MVTCMHVSVVFSMINWSKVVKTAALVHYSKCCNRLFKSINGNPAAIGPHFHPVSICLSSFDMQLIYSLKIMTYFFVSSLWHQRTFHRKYTSGAFKGFKNFPRRGRWWCADDAGWESSISIYYLSVCMA